jgi:hypothetical protein
VSERSISKHELRGDTLALETKPEPNPETPTPAPAAAAPLPPPAPAPIADVNAILATVADTLVVGAVPLLGKLLAVELAGVSAPLLADAAKALIASEAFAIFRKPAGPAPGSVEASAEALKAQQSLYGGIGSPVGPDGKINLAGTAHIGLVQPGTPAADAMAAQQAQARQAAVEQKMRENPGMNPFLASTSLKIEADRLALKLATGLIVMK